MARRARSCSKAASGGSGGEARLSPRIRSEDRGEFALQHRSVRNRAVPVATAGSWGGPAQNSAAHRPGVRRPGGTIARRNAYVSRYSG